MTRRQVRVMIVESNRDAAQVMKLIIAGWGADVYVAYDGAEALDMADWLKPDVVLLDILAVATGHDLARRLKAARWARRLRIIAVSSWGQDYDHIQSLKAGIERHLTTPVSARDLRAAVFPA